MSAKTTQLLSSGEFWKLRYDNIPVKGGWVHTVTLPRTVTPYRDSVDGTRDHVTYQKLVTR